MDLKGHFANLPSQGEDATLLGGVASGTPLPSLQQAPATSLLLLNLVQLLLLILSYIGMYVAQ
jgi:hypothetical protein